MASVLLMWNGCIWPSVYWRSAGVSITRLRPSVLVLPFVPSCAWEQQPQDPLKWKCSEETRPGTVLFPNCEMLQWQQNISGRTWCIKNLKLCTWVWRLNIKASFFYLIVSFNAKWSLFFISPRNHLIVKLFYIPHFLAFLSSTHHVLF